ncbi:MAG: hypothetical protein M3162_01685 [Thermoproteota archaeon]|nr:hypothetical protein [Thermoproteota archaeon]
MESSKPIDGAKIIIVLSRLELNTLVSLLYPLFAIQIDDAWDLNPAMKTGNPIINGEFKDKLRWIC